MILDSGKTARMTANVSMMFESVVVLDSGKTISFSRRL